MAKKVTISDYPPVHTVKWSKYSLNAYYRVINRNAKFTLLHITIRQNKWHIKFHQRVNRQADQSRTIIKGIYVLYEITLCVLDNNHLPAAFTFRATYCRQLNSLAAVPNAIHTTSCNRHGLATTRLTTSKWPGSVLAYLFQKQLTWWAYIQNSSQCARFSNARGAVRAVLPS